VIISVKAARWATFVYCGLNGFVMETWIVHIPFVLPAGLCAIADRNL
jgi:hypothetical protein